MSADTTIMTAAREPRGTIVVLSHLRWDFVTQRPQHLLTRAAHDFDIVFIEEPVWEENPQEDVHDAIRPPRVRVVQPVVRWHSTPEQAVAASRAALDMVLSGLSGPIVLWYYTPMALAFSADARADAIVFDKMDELSAFAAAPPELVAYEERLLDRADVVFTGGASMHRAAVHRHGNIHCFPSSIDAAHFSVARDGAADPVDQAGIAQPRIGFFGVIDERMDVALIGAVACARPDWQFVMIGPTAKIDPADLPRTPNLHWLGSKDYQELPAYLSGWAVGWMPFAINDATKYISPTKTPEFLAAGIPVVSTAITDVVTPYADEGLVTIASALDDTVAALQHELDKPDRAEWLARVDGRLAQGSWDRTWAEMRALIEDVLTKSKKESARV